MLNDLLETNIEKIPHSIRTNGSSEIKGSEFVKIEKKTSGDGFDLYVLPGAKCEKIAVPVIITEGGIDETVYNTFHLAEGTSCNIIAGCVVDNNDSQNSSHIGVHEFILEEGAVCIYEETHVGYGTNKSKIINNDTIVKLSKNSNLSMSTKQIEGVDKTDRSVKACIEDGAKLIVKEKLLTADKNIARTHFDIELKGENSRCEISSRSVAVGESIQEFESSMIGNKKCYGRVECDVILKDKAMASSNPRVDSRVYNAELTHEATIGVIAKEQVEKLMTLGLSREDAEMEIINGFLK